MAKRLSILQGVKADELEKKVNKELKAGTPVDLNHLRVVMTPQGELRFALPVIKEVDDTKPEPTT